MDKIDLHVHTTASDGTFTPTEAVKLAAENGLRAIAVTDHDTILGCEEAISAGKELGVEVIPGLEISTKFQGAVHILGYCMDTASPVLTTVMEWEVKDRDERNIRVCELMAADGLPVTYDMMRERFGVVVGRPHFAQVLVELGLAESVQDAFSRLVGRGMKYYLARNFLSIEKSIETISASGGIPVLAHPFQYKLSDEDLRKLIEHSMESGLRGMECRYTGYDADMVNYLEKLADEYGLIKTGGSDFHGANKPKIGLGTGHGELNVPYEWLEKLKAAKR